MISNYILRDRILKLQQRQSELTSKKLEYAKELGAMGISNNQALSLNKGKDLSWIPQEVRDRRKEVVKLIMGIDGELIKIKLELKELHSGEDAEKNKKLLEVF